MHNIWCVRYVFYLNYFQKHVVLNICCCCLIDIAEREKERNEEGYSERQQNESAEIEPDEELEQEQGMKDSALLNII